MPISDKNLTDTLARLGARARIQELDQERAAILRKYPDALGPAPKTPKKRGRRPMTAAEKKAASIRMKKIWADKRKANK